MNAPPALAIHRLCSRAAAREPVVARLALTALASDVADSLASLPVLPPQSLLLLRRMSLAVPGLSLERIPDSGVRADASRLARKQVADACAHAARPAHEAVSDLAPAVLFGDEAELLACLARDALAGRLDHWWWRALLGSHYPDWQAAWHQRPQATAGALRLLARAGLEATVLAALGKTGQPQQTRDAVRSPSPAPPAVAADAAPVPTAASEGARQRPGFAPSPDAGSSEPLLASVPAFAPVAKLTGQAQLPASSSTAASPPGTVSVATHPTRALAETGAAASASTDPANAAFTERRPVTDEGDRNAAPPAKAALLLPAGVRDTARAPPHAPAANLAGTPAPQTPSANLTAPPRSVRFIDDELRPTISPLPPVASAPSPRPAATASPQPSAGDAQRSERPMSVPDSPEPSRRAQSDIAGTQARPHDQALAPPPLLAATPQAIVSRHARLLFLVNMLLGDDLYPDFTRPADPGFPLPIWRLLLLLGDSLLGASLRDDPLRPLLERLAAELPDRSTGNDCNFARDWPLPGSLPDSLPGSLPGSLPAKRPWRLRRERRDGFAHWFACYRQTVRSRLAQALAVPPALAGRAIAQGDGQALLWVSEASLVVVHQLDRHPVAWRLAGLDRDPGYLPSAGRSLRFVFE